MTRPFYLLFGAVAYVIFFATFLYLIAFVGNAPFVPLTIDRGPEAAIGTAIALDLGLIALFGIQHSVMARQGFKAAWTRMVPKPIERSMYVLLASLMLGLLYLFWRPIPAIVWQVATPILVAMLWAIFAVGWAVVLLSTFLISHFELFGLKQVWQHSRGGEDVAPQFRQPFFYKLVRHPLYTGFLLAFFSMPVMTAGHLLFALAMTGYVLIAIHHEEKDLVGLFGDDYRDYRDRVGKLTPRLRR